MILKLFVVWLSAMIECFLSELNVSLFISVSVQVLFCPPLASRLWHLWQDHWPCGPLPFIQSGRLHWREAAVFKSPLWQLWQVSAPHTHHLTLSIYTTWLWHTLLCSIDVFVVFKHYGTIMILRQCVCTCCVVNIPKLKICTNNVLLIYSTLQSDFWHHHSCDGHPGRSEWRAIEQEAEDQNLSSWSTSLCCRTPPRCSLSLSVHHVCSG